MIAELGHYLLILAFGLALIQAFFPMVGAARGDGRMMMLGQPAAFGQFLFALLAFLALTYSYLVSDFSVRVVASNSHSLKPMLYKISGVWGNHEGSLLLWVMFLALFGAMVAYFGHHDALNEAGVFIASRVLAKHDENYMPKEVIDSLKKRGQWQQDATEINNLGQQDATEINNLGKDGDPS